MLSSYSNGPYREGCVCMHRLWWIVPVLFYIMKQDTQYHGIPALSLRVPTCCQSYCSITMVRDPICCPSHPIIHCTLGQYVTRDNHEIHSPVQIAIRRPIYYTIVRFGFVYFSSSALVLALEPKVHQHFLFNAFRTIKTWFNFSILELQKVIVP